ncbi:endosome-associated-trafficking regulator 1-like [Lineus longissimus]|uniref:endosome-associated-trafficking regulator 1-like n=1 Tax=Lineus longissimus TaxID=88925 RepID=UPI002B4CCE64
MAEGGQKDGQNPFSFQSFVKKKTNPNDKGNQDDSFDDSEDDIPDDIFESPDIPKAKAVKNVKNQLLIADEEFDPEAPQKKKDSKKPVRKEENPFSFKKFLKKDPTPPPGRSNYTNGGGSSGPAPDFANDLPDFVQDHFTGNEPRSRSSSNRSRPRTQSEVSLPDFALDSSPKDGSLFPSINAIGNLIHHRDDAARSGSASRNIAATNGGVDNDTVTVSPRHGGLPDFLSESVGYGADGNNGASNVIRREVSPLVGTEDLTVEVKKLQEENRTLSQKLHESRQVAERESNRVTTLLSEMQILQKRESEETAALENMVQQVEANLQITTKRAVKAENTIVKLRQEIKGLQNQVGSLTAEKIASCSGDPYLDDMRDKTQYIATQLSSAAQNADQSLRQLLSGVTNLRLMSDILQNIGKLTVPDEPASADTPPEASNTPPSHHKTQPTTAQQKAQTPPTQKNSSPTPPTQRKDPTSSPSKSKLRKAQDKKDCSPSKT